MSLGPTVPLGYRIRDRTPTASSQVRGDKSGHESPSASGQILSWGTGSKPTIYSRDHLLLVGFCLLACLLACFFLEIRSHVAQAVFEPLM